MIHLICFTPDKYLFRLPGQRPQSPNRWPKAPLVHPPHGGQEGSFRLQPRTPHALPRSLRCSPCVPPHSLSPHLCHLRAFARSVREPFSSSPPHLRLRSLLKGACTPPFSLMPNPSRDAVLLLQGTHHTRSRNVCQGLFVDVPVLPYRMLSIPYVTECATQHTVHYA